MRIKFLAAAFFFLGGVISTHAQAGRVKVWVPFEFGVANKTLPPGAYVVWADHDQVWLRVYQGNVVAAVQSNRTVHDGGKTGKVVFNCYEKLCFLSQLWLPDADAARQILTSKSEKQAAKREESQQFALLGEAAK